MLPVSAAPGPRRRQCRNWTNLLVRDGFVLKRLHSPIGGLDDLTPEVLQLQHKAKGTRSAGRPAPAGPGAALPSRGPRGLSEKGLSTVDGRYRLSESPCLAGRGRAHRREGNSRF